MILQPVILSGGSGTRLWPMSREKYPKQLLSFIGGETMLQATASRLATYHSEDVTSAAPPIVVCNEEYRFLSAEQMRPTGGRILLEPAGRNTAPATTIAALLAVTAAPARAQDAPPDAAVTADSCTPQPRCRALYTTMHPGRHFDVVLLHRRMMMHRRRIAHHAAGSR